MEFFKRLMKKRYAAGANVVPAATEQPQLNATVLQEMENGIYTSPYEHGLRNFLANTQELVFATSVRLIGHINLGTGETTEYTIKAATNTYKPASRIHFLNGVMHEETPPTLLDYNLLPRSIPARIWTNGQGSYQGSVQDHTISNIAGIMAMDVGADMVALTMQGSLRSLPMGGVLVWQRSTGDCAADIDAAIKVGLVPIEYAVGKTGQIIAVNFIKPDENGQVEILPDRTEQLRATAKELLPLITAIHLLVTGKAIEGLTVESLMGHDGLHFSIPTEGSYLALHLSIDDLYTKPKRKPEDYFPVIKNIYIPVSLRRKGFGVKLVELVERQMTGYGYHTIVATNPTKTGKQFWIKRLGYADSQMLPSFLVEKKDYMYYKPLE